MRLPTRLRRGDTGINMTPLIDVVFLLIIFFLVSSHLAQQEAHLPLPLPTAATGEDDWQLDRPRLTINVRGDGQLVAAGQPIDVGRLGGLLRERQEAAKGPLEVRIRSDRGVAYRLVEPVLKAASQAGIWNITFAVYRPEDVR